MLIIVLGKRNKKMLRRKSNKQLPMQLNIVSVVKWLFGFSDFMRRFQEKPVTLAT